MIPIILLVVVLGVVLSISRMNKNLKVSERIIYIAYCIMTLGLFWALKVLIKTAILEANKEG